VHVHHVDRTCCELGPQHPAGAGRLHRVPAQPLEVEVEVAEQGDAAGRGARGAAHRPECREPRFDALEPGEAGAETLLERAVAEQARAELALAEEEGSKGPGGRLTTSG
jgi:hypothetical protein